LGGGGVASYMSKYLGKADSYNELVRADGRAIRRYCRSRGWSKSRIQPIFRYARCGVGIAREPQSMATLPCVCGEGQIIRRDIQAQKWVDAVRRERSWVAPLSFGDYILEKERKKEQ